MKTALIVGAVILAWYLLRNFIAGAVLGGAIGGVFG